MPRRPCHGILAAVIIVSVPMRALADPGTRTRPENIWNAWTLDPLVLFTLTLAGLLYRRGLTRLRARARADRRENPAYGACYYASLALIALILLSPLDALSAELSAAHMVQHMLLMIVAAPLFVLGSPTMVLLHAMPKFWRQLLGFTWLTHWATWHAGVVWTLLAVALWSWHHPTMYQAALRDPLVHDAQHLSLFLAAFLFWRILLDPLSRRRLHSGAAIPYLFATSLHASVLGVFMTLAPAPWYSDYADRTPVFGLSPLADQQLAGLIMWIPGCLIFPIVAVALVIPWLHGPSDEQAITAKGRLA